VHPSPVHSLDSQAKPVGGFEREQGWSGAPLFDQRVLGLRCSPFRSAFTPSVSCGWNGLRASATPVSRQVWCRLPRSWLCFASE
jgi:hypothetical protein